MRPFRSFLFVPGHKAAWVEKAVAAGADAVVLDLEDSVPAAQKEVARAIVAETIASLRSAGHDVGVLVRPNPLITGLTSADLEAVVVPGLNGLFLPKVERERDIVAYDALVDHFEVRNGVEGLEYVIPVETVKGIQNCRDCANASPRVAAMVGPTAEHADIARAVGFEWTPEGLESLYLRSRVLLACREAEIHAVTALWEDLDNLEGLKDFATRGRELGFRGMIAIHPSHVAVINEVFSPPSDRIRFYEGLIQAYRDAEARGEGAARYGNVHIDKAHYDKALEWLANAQRVPGRTAADSTERSTSAEARDR
jgi:citrate lyase subunit beta/citryl-CoA lyase